MHTKTFIHQLHTILNDPGLSEWIRWSDEQEGVFVLKPFDKWFSALVLKRYFKHGNVSSFVRQLHMYGFHKMSNFGSESASASTGHSISNTQSRGALSQPRDKTATIWYFTHPLGIFTKDASAATLNKIPRKSTGVGRDGKRKNVLSTVCVNYISQNEPTRDISSPLNGRTPEDLQISEFNSSCIGTRQHYNSLPAPQVLHLRDPIWNKSRATSLPEIVTRPLPTVMTPISDSGPPVVQSQLQHQCHYSTPPSSVSRQYDVQLNVHFLQRTLVSIAEVLPLILRPSLSQQDSQQILSMLQSLKQNFFSNNLRSYDCPPCFNSGSASSNFDDARNWYTE